MCGNRDGALSPAPFFEKNEDSLGGTLNKCIYENLSRRGYLIHQENQKIRISDKSEKVIH